MIDRYTKTEYVLQALQFMSVKQRLYHSVCIFIYKILNNMLPVSLRNKIEIESESQRQTRQAGNIVLGLRKIRNAQKSVFYEGVKLYNSLPFRIKQCDRLKIFKRELKEYMLNTIFLVTLIDSIISLFCYVLHFVFLFLYFMMLFFVLCILLFYILYLKTAEKTK